MSMKRQVSIYVAALLALIYAGLQSGARAQVFDFGQIEEFESLGSGTQKGGSPPKTIIDDGARHTVLFTILESNTEAKIYWKSKTEARQRSCAGRACGPFRPSANSGSRPPAMTAGASDMDTCCFA